MAKGDFAKQSFTGMPQWAKGVIGVGLLLGAGYLVYKIMKAPKKFKEGQGARDETKALNQELDKLNSNPATKQTLKKSEALDIANQMFTAMDGWGTNGGAIMTAFTRIKNDADWLAVKTAYDIREVSSGRGNPEPNLNGTLVQAFASELGVNDIVWVNQINQLLAKRKINYKIPVG